MAKTTIIKRSTDNSRDANMKNIMSQQYRSKVFDYIKQLREDRGMNYTDIAHLLNKEGWCGPSGGKLTQPTLSKFMGDQGYKIFEHKTTTAAKAASGDTVQIPVLDLGSTDLVRDIIKVLQMPLSETAKRRIIATIVNDPSFKIENGDTKK